MKSQKEGVKPIDQEKAPLRTKIVTDPITGFPALTAGKGAPVLTSEMVAEMLADFP